MNTTHLLSTLRATSHTRVKACDQYTSSTLIGGKGEAGPSSLHTNVKGEPIFCVMMAGWFCEKSSSIGKVEDAGAFKN